MNLYKNNFSSNKEELDLLALAVIKLFSSTLLSHNNLQSIAVYLIVQHLVTKPTRRVDCQIDVDLLDVCILQDQMYRVRDRCLIVYNRSKGLNYTSDDMLIHVIPLSCMDSLLLYEKPMSL